MHLGSNMLPEAARRAQPRLVSNRTSLQPCGGASGNTRLCDASSAGPLAVTASLRPSCENHHRRAPGEMLDTARASFQRQSVESRPSVFMRDVAKGADRRMHARYRYCE